MVIYPCFFDDIESILDNSCMCLNVLILVFYGTFLEQKDDFLMNIHVLIVIVYWKPVLNQ
jgi:hypothetical protein